MAIYMMFAGRSLVKHHGSMSQAMSHKHAACMHHASCIYRKHASSTCNKSAQKKNDSKHVRLDMCDKSGPALLGIFPTERMIDLLTLFLAAPLLAKVRSVNLPIAWNCDRVHFYPCRGNPWVPLPDTICRHRGSWPLQNL